MCFGGHLGVKKLSVSKRHKNSAFNPYTQCKKVIDAKIQNGQVTVVIDIKKPLERQSCFLSLSLSQT